MALRPPAAFFLPAPLPLAMSSPVAAAASATSPAASLNNISTADRLNPLPPRSATTPLSQPGDEVQFAYLADRLDLVPEVSALIFKEWEQIFHDYYDLHTAEQVTEWMHAEVMHRNRLGTCVVATINGELACSAQLCTEDTPVGHAYYGTTPWLTCVYTNEAFRGRGVATQLLQRLCALAEEWGYGQIWLITQHMQRVYAKYEFRSIETVEVFGAPYTVMRRDFPKNGGQSQRYTEEDAKKSHAIIHPH